MKSKPQWLRKMQALSENALNALNVASEKLTEVSSKVEAQAKEVDASYGISSAVISTTRKAKDAAREFNKEHQLDTRLTTACQQLGRKLDEVKDSDTYKTTVDRVARAGEQFRGDVVNPIDSYLDESGIKTGLNIAADTAVNLYGISRSYLKPYFAPETPQELLESTKEELLYINACILQVSPGEAEQLANKFGAAVASKVAGAASAAAVLGMVSSFGTAGTGTAIATLSGAAANNASLAWVGGLLGGGMAIGAAITGGLALAVGIGTYRILASEARRFENLTDVEKRVVESTGFLVAAINDILKDQSKQLTYNDAAHLLNNTLRPMHQLLLDHAEAIAVNLDGKNSVALKQHGLIDFDKKVIQGFEFFLKQEQASRRKRYPEFAIAGALYALLTETAVDESRENQLALDALRRMRNDWNHASEAELSDALSAYDAEQLKGVANNVKGIYHEMLFVDDYNRSSQDSYAEMFEATNHVGADVVIRSSQTHEVIAEYQLKAGSSDQIIREHFEKYPDIDVLATEEIARQYGMVEGSGYTNEELTTHINSVIDDVGGNTLMDRVEGSAALAGLAAAGIESLDVLKGKRGISEAGINVIKSAGLAGSSTALVAYLFG